MSEPHRDEIQRRVNALAAGARDPRSLDRIFSWLRFRTHGHRLMRDVGDFACHFTDRDQGQTFEGAQLITDALMTFSWNFWQLGHMGPPNATAGEVAKALEAGLAIKDPAWFRPALGISKETAKKVLAAALPKIGGISNGRVVQVAQLSEREGKVFGAFANSMPDYLFTSGQLAEEFVKVLRLNKLLDERDAPSLPSRIEGFVAVYAIEKMHRRKLIPKTGYPIDLYAGLFGPHLAIYGDFVTRWGDKEAGARLPVFTSTCKPEDWFDGWTSGAINVGDCFGVPLELNGSGKLAIL